MIAVYRDKALGWLGAPPSPDLAAWDAYIKALRSDLDAAWQRARSSYLTLKKIRTGLGLPFMVQGAPPEAGAAPGMSSAASWNKTLDQQAVDVMAMVTLATQAVDGVVAGKRKLFWNDKSKDFDIEALPDDLLRLTVQLNPTTGQRLPVLVSTKTGKPPELPIEGTIGLPVIAWVGAAAAGGIVALGAYFVIMKACETLEVVAKEKTIKTALETQASLVQTGKATPEQAAMMSKTVFNAAAGLEESRAKAAAAAAAAPDKFADTIKTLGYIALGLGVLYAIIRLVPPIERAPRAALAPPLTENPRRRPRPQSGYAYRLVWPLGTVRPPPGHARLWQRAPDGEWEMRLITPDVEPAYRWVGRRFIDGAEVNVWNSGDRYVAQTVVMTGRAAA